MRSHFQRNLKTTSGFLLVRFVVSLFVAVVYIFVAAAIQYAVVKVLGETTFNYLVGGLLSLFLGVIICERGGALLFMFVRGWHVAALAYVDKIRKSHAPAVTVGMKAFAKNIVGFGAVYGVRLIAKNLLSDFKDKLWDLLQDVPYAQNLRGFTENPIVTHMAGDVLNYGFDATIFYLIKNPPENVGDTPATVIEGLKRYLYCLPSIMLTSIGSYILFRFIPQFLKYLIIIFVLVTQGILPGILITVLMWPLFYILSNTFFKPLTMVMFISCFSKECSKEVDKESKTVQFVDSILDGVDIGTSADDIGEGEDEEPEHKPKLKRAKKDAPSEEEPTPEPEPEPAPVVAQEKVPDELELDVEPDMGQAIPHMDAGDIPPPSTWMRPSTPPPMPEDTGVPPPTFTGMWDMPEGLDGIPFSDQAKPAPETPPESTGRGTSLSSILKGFNSQDLSRPIPGLDGDDDDDGSDEIKSILSGGDF